MSDGQQKWKSRLLSSGVPLEYEVAKQLSKEGFAVKSEHTYSRIDSGHAKDFSIDLEATHYFETKDKGIDATLDLLIECKFGHPNKKWLFFPDPNQPDFSPMVVGTTLSAVDAVSAVDLKGNATISFDEDLPFCIKGVELDIATGEASEQTVQRGLHQLLYSFPSYFCWQLYLGLIAHNDDRFPFFHASILITSNDLYVANSSISLAAINKAEKLEQLGKKVPYLVTYLGKSPDYRNHVTFTAKQILPENCDKWASEWPYEAKYNWEHPKEILKTIKTRGSFGLTSGNGQIIVCGQKALPELLKVLKRTAQQALKKTTPKKKASLRSNPAVRA